jgi:hypothetical protein
MKRLFNPFEKYSETRLLIVGLLLTIAGSFLAYAFSTRLDGVLHASPMAGVTFIQPFIDNFIITLSLFGVLYAFGVFINKKTRLIDILNTVLISHSTMYLTLFGNWGGFIENISPAKVPSGTELLLLMVFGLFTIALLVWFIALLYNGFKTATNLKTVWQKVAFGVLILVADVISRLLISYINY